jgi:hypothetical protein
VPTLRPLQRRAVPRRSDGVVEPVQYHDLIPMLPNELQRQQRELA